MSVLRRGVHVMFAGVMLVVLCLPPAGGSQSTPPAAALATFFKRGVVFQDRNSDGAIDYVNARIVLAEEPTAGELAAAADVAARLGFETSAIDLPLVARSLQASGSGSAEAVALRDAPTIFVGAKSLVGSGTTAGSLGAASLKAGEGLVAAFTASGQPAVAVLGADEAGFNTAVVMLAGHLPYVWDQKSPTTDKIADEVKQWLTGKGVTVSSALAP
ncbi:MAG TPA: hypothetical protein VGJ78_14050, partial [Vicinamibacterales bacterium]